MDLIKNRSLKKKRLDEETENVYIYEMVLEY